MLVPAVIPSQGQSFAFSLLNPMRFLSDHFSSLLMLWERAAQPSPLSTTLSGVIILKPAEGALCHHPDHWWWTLSTSALTRGVHWFTVGLQLGFVVLLSSWDFHPPHCPISQSVQHMTHENNVGSSDKSLAESQTELNPLPSSTKPVISPYKALRLVKYLFIYYLFPFYNPMQIALSHLLVFRSLERVSMQQQVLRVFFLGSIHLKIFWWI